MLNQIDDESINWFIDEARRNVNGAVDAAVLWKAHFVLATHLYRQGASDREVRQHFVQAARYGLATWSERSRPTARTSRTPWQFGLMLGVVAAFGDAAQRATAGTIERWKWFHPEEEFYLLLADSLSQLQSFLAGRFSPDEAVAVVERCKGGSADRDALRFDGPLVEALLAIHRQDVKGLESQLATMVEEHRHRALEGVLQFHTDGLVAVLPLGLVRLARDAGLDPAVDSPYVPVSLL